jgi:hypothetical protein
MSEQRTNDSQDDIPAFLRRGKKQPQKVLYARIPLRQWEALVELSREYNQDVTAFGEAMEDWLRRARNARNAEPTDNPLSPGAPER